MLLGKEAPQLVTNVLLSAVGRSATLLRVWLAIRKLAPQLIVETRGFFAEARYERISA